MQGPYAPDLVPWLRRHARTFDVVVFITYLYWTTWAGLRECAGAVPTLLAPDRARRAAAATLDLPGGDARARRVRVPHARRGRSRARALSRLAARRCRRHRRRDRLAGRRRRVPAPFELGAAPYLLYVGRVDPAKGAAELIDYFVAYKQRNPSDLQLVLLGELLVDDPARPDIVVTGFVDEPTRERRARRRAARWCTRRTSRASRWC